MRLYFTSLGQNHTWLFASNLCLPDTTTGGCNLSPVAMIVSGGMLGPEMMPRRGTSPEMHFLGTLKEIPQKKGQDRHSTGESHQDDLTQTGGQPGIFLMSDTD